METDARGGRRQPARLTFTKGRLSDLPTPTTGRVFYYDEKVPGLALGISAGGSRVYYIYRKSAGKPVRIRLGTFGDLSIENARRLGQAVLGDLAGGKDVQAERRQARQSATLDDLFSNWVETHAKPHKRTWGDDLRIYRKYLETFHHRRLDTIKASEVATWHGRIGQEHGPIQANRCIALLATLFNAGDRVGFTGRNPCDGVKRFREESRDRYLLPQEMRQFFQALETEPLLWRDFFLVCLFTGCRRGNVAGMRWEQLDLEGGVWRIPRPKNDKPQYVPLVAPILGLLTARLESRDSSPWVFGGAGKTGRVVDPRRAWKRIIERSGLTNLRMHDLRRSLGSWLAGAGTSLTIIGATLGHRDLKSTQVYSRLSLDTVRQAVGQATQAMIAAGGEVTPQNTEGKSDG